MAIVNVLANLKVWIAIGFVAGLLFGSIGGLASTLMIVVLIIQMSISLDGLNFRKSDMKAYSRPIFWGIVCCFVINSGITIFVGSFFIPVSTAIWYGWVMLASVPSAVSVVSASLYLKGNTKATIIMTSAIYLAALVITPLISWILLGSAVSPLQVLKYIAMFIVVPLVASRLLKSFTLPKRGKIIFINVMMALLMFLALGSNRDYIISELNIVFWVIFACFIRTFVLGIVMTYALKKMATDRDMSMIYVLFSVWKNSGMATSLSMVLLSGMAEAAIPGVISLIMETMWFSTFTSHSEKMWPRKENVVTTAE